jgi:photosystem II stability/assembly factor-like uncharacterized protein
MRRVLLAVAVLAFVQMGARAQDPGSWRDLGSALRERGARLGYSGIEVDRTDGTVYLLGKGVYRSKDGGGTWQEIAGENVVGHQWYAHALRLDPNGGGRLAVFKKDPRDAPLQSAMTLDAGASWSPISRVLIEGDKLRSYGWSWGVVDWASKEPNFMIGKMHHSNRMWKSTDAGKSWTEMSNPGRGGTDYMGLWDARTLVAADPQPRGRDKKPRIFRSTDAGESWQLVSEEFRVTQWIPIRLDERLYWLVKDGLIVSADAGKTWTHAGGKLKDAYFGPYFGRTAKDVIVGTMEGIYRSGDGGATWERIADNIAVDLVEKRAEKKDGKYRFDWFIGQADFGWDPIRDKLYLTYKGFYELDLKKAEQ